MLKKIQENNKLYTRLIFLITLTITIIALVFCGLLNVKDANASSLDSNNKGESGIYFKFDIFQYLKVDTKINECIDDKGVGCDFENTPFSRDVEITGGVLDKGKSLVVTPIDHENKPIYVDIVISDKNDDGIYEKIQVNSFYEYNLVYVCEDKILDENTIISNGSVDKYIGQYIKKFDNYKFNNYEIIKNNVKYNYSYINPYVPINPDNGIGINTQTGDSLILFFVILMVVSGILSSLILNKNKVNKRGCDDK